MNRRSFIQRIGAAVIGLTLARTLPGIAPQPLDVTPPDGYACDTLMMGDAFTIEGHYEFSPVTRQKTGQLKQFVVTAQNTVGRA